MAVGKALLYVVLLQDSSLHCVGEEKHKGDNCKKQSRQYGVECGFFT